MTRTQVEEAARYTFAVKKGEDRCGGRCCGLGVADADNASKWPATSQYQGKHPHPAAV